MSRCRLFIEYIFRKSTLGHSDCRRINIRARELWTEYFIFIHVRQCCVFFYGCLCSCLLVYPNTHTTQMLQEKWKRDESVSPASRQPTSTCVERIWDGTAGPGSTVQMFDVLLCTDGFFMSARRISGQRQGLNVTIPRVKFELLVGGPLRQ